MSRRTLPIFAALFMLGTAHATAFAQAAQPSDPSNGATTYSNVQDASRDWYAYNPCQHESIHIRATTVLVLEN